MSAHALDVFRSLLLISAANAAPILAAKALRLRKAHPIDGGIMLPDGRPLLGRSKTWRGLVSAVVLASCVGALIGLPWRLGALVGVSAMLGDGLSSFVKRRFALESAAGRSGSTRFRNSCVLRSRAPPICR